MTSSQSGIVDAITRQSADMDAVLTTIDDIVSGLAVLCLLVATVRWLVRGRRDPLAAARSHPTHVSENSLALVVAVYLAALFALSGVAGLVTGDDANVLARMLIGSGAQLAGAACVLAVAAARFPGGVRPFLIGERNAGAPLGWRGVAFLLVLAIGGCPLVRDLTVALILYFAPGFDFPAHPTMDALHDPDLATGVVAALWLSAAVLAPFAEELFFRGLLQTYLVGVLGNRWLAIGLVSLAFGAVHAFQPYAVPALAMLSVVLGFAYERTGSLTLPILIHAAFNLKTLVWDALSSHC